MDFLQQRYAITLSSSWKIAQLYNAGKQSTRYRNSTTNQSSVSNWKDVISGTQFNKNTRRVANKMWNRDVVTSNENTWKDECRGRALERGKWMTNQVDGINKLDGKSGPRQKQQIIAFPLKLFTQNGGKFLR